MEVFDGDRRIGNDGVFPDHIAPFPETSVDFLYHYHHSSPTALPSSEEAEVMAPPLRENLLPQKLRPIRCSARSPPVSGDVLSCGAAGLGFLSSGGCAVGSGAFLPIAACSGQSSVPEDTTNNVKMGSSEDESSSSDDDSSEDAVARSNTSKKRVRSRKMLELSIENMVMKVMERQEQMYKQLIETIEKRERERITREEAWQQQQIERSNQNEKLITQSITRNASLISLVEKVLGHEIPEQPEPLNSFHPEGDECRRRWPKSEVEALISLRTASNHKFQTPGSKIPVWEEISQGMSNMGYERSAKKCKEKWENINKYFKRSTVDGKSSKNRCLYFRDLDILYKTGAFSDHGCIRDCKSTDDEDRADGR